MDGTALNLKTAYSQWWVLKGLHSLLVVATGQCHMIPFRERDQMGHLSPKDFPFWP